LKRRKTLLTASSSANNKIEKAGWATGKIHFDFLFNLYKRFSLMNVARDDDIPVETQAVGSVERAKH